MSRLAMHFRLPPALIAACLFALPAQAAHGASIDAPSFREIMHILLLRDYNTRLVVLSTAVLGMAAGLIGSFLLLRKRSLIGDALSHATLPGIAVAFMLMVALGGNGKWLPGLLVGAAIAGWLGVACVQLIRSTTRLGDDAAMGIVLSVFFGVGVAILGLIQDMPQGSAAGLESFIYGKTASMIMDDFKLIIIAAAAVVVICLLMFKEMTLLCFDEGYARSQGWPVKWLDMLMLLMVTAVTVIGLQAVGLILIIALLITPSAAARFWTERLHVMLLIAAGIGAASGWLGASVSALLPRMPAGAVIVVVGSSIFLFSMIFGSSRGVLRRTIERHLLNRKVRMQHTLRAIFELMETVGGNDVAFDELKPMRSWSSHELKRGLNLLLREGMAMETSDHRWKLTDQGHKHAARTVRNHRLWEVFLVTHADIAPSHVDRNADMIEHVLAPEMVEKLEQLLAAAAPAAPLPPSLHRMGGDA